MEPNSPSVLRLSETTRYWFGLVRSGQIVRLLNIAVINTLEIHSVLRDAVHTASTRRIADPSRKSLNIETVFIRAVLPDCGKPTVNVVAQYLD